LLNVVLNAFDDFFYTPFNCHLNYKPPC